jgi:hypothetical protein
MGAALARTCALVHSAVRGQGDGATRPALWDLFVLAWPAMRADKVLVIVLVLLSACAAQESRGRLDASGDDERDSSEEEGDASDLPDEDAEAAAMDAGGDAAPADAGSIGVASDGGRLPPGPPVDVTVEGAGALQFHGSDVCLLNQNGDIQCRNLPPVWKPYRKGPFKAFAIGSLSGCAIAPDDTVQCWADSGRDSVCSTPSDCIAEGKPPAEKYAQLSFYGQTACGVTLDGRLLCWGKNDNGRATPPTGNDFARVTLASSLSCALRRDGSATCWAPSSSSATSAIAGQGKQVGIGDRTICLLGQDGRVSCVGSDSDLAKDKQAQELAQISMDRYAMCGLTKAGAARCWSLFSDTFQRVPPPVGPFKSILATPQYACGLRGDGQMECWGYFWGNGSGSESCLLDQSRLSLDGQPERIEGMGGFADDRAPAGLRSSISSEYGFALFDGADAGAPNLRAGTPDAGSVVLRSSLWLLAATDTSVGDLYCSGPGGQGTARRHDDELLVDFSDVALLGQCPGGEVVEGSLSACFRASPCATTALTGTLRGESKNIAQRYESGTGITTKVGFVDGSILIAHQRSDQARWAVLVLPPDAAGLSEVLCTGSVSKSGGTWTFGGFTSLGRCNGGGTHTVKGCLR